jgi:hypothetical protein
MVNQFVTNNHFVQIEYIVILAANVFYTFLQWLLGC